MPQRTLPLDYLPSRINRLFLAFSGGLDSTVLLHQLLAYRYSYKLILWHINHGLQDIADDMESFARRQAEHYRLELQVDRLYIDPADGNIEAKARQLRYQLFEGKLSSSDALLTAHHMNDQAETLLLNLMRGSGVRGLSAIAMQRPLGKGILFRPLLDQTRGAIHEYAKIHDLQWFEDPSNASVHFDRNYVRHQVIPVLLERWPAAVQQLHTASEWQAEARLLIDELAQQDYQATAKPMPFTPYTCLSVEFIRQFFCARRKNLLHFWLQTQGKMPLGHKKMQNLESQLGAKQDALPLVPGNGYDIRIYAQHLYIVDTASDPQLASRYSIPDSGPLHIGAIGFDQDRKSLLAYLGQTDTGQQLELRFRHAMETGEVYEYQHKLKRLFQRHRVPPWFRPRIPQIFVDGELCALWLEA
jgi:tRNA(Ile)-lysidine synthase